MDYRSLGSLVERKIGYGIVQPGQSVPNGVPVVKVNNLISGLRSKSELETTSTENDKKYARTRLQGGEIIISVVGTIGKTAIVPPSFAGCNLVRATALIDIKDRWLAHWVKYYLDSPQGQSYIEQNLNTTVQPTLNIKSLVDMPIPFPDEDIMKKTVTVLGAFDDKIDCNKKINDNLQRQLLAIFRARFTENALIESMCQVPLSELCSVVTKGTTPTTLGKAFVNCGINFIKAESISDNHTFDKGKFAHIDEETQNLLKRSVIQSGDIVFTIAGTLGRFAMIDSDILPANTNQAIAIIRADKSKISPEYLYCCFIGNWHNDYYTKRIQQAVQANLSLTTIKSLPIPVLGEDEMSDYLQLITPIIALLKNNEREHERLVSIRDSLLPKLMNGEIDASNINL